MATSVEIVIYAYGASHKFPWILNCFKIDAFYFYKLIEIIISNEEGILSRDLIKHLNAVSILFGRQTKCHLNLSLPIENTQFHLYENFYLSHLEQMTRIDCVFHFMFETLIIFERNKTVDILFLICHFYFDEYISFYFFFFSFLI